MYNRALTISEIEKRISELETLKVLILKALESEGSSMESQVLKKYVEIQSVTDVAEFMNLQGNRIKTGGHRKGERKFISNDIKSFIVNASKTDDLAILAKVLFNYNKGELELKSVVSSCSKSK